MYCSNRNLLNNTLHNANNKCENRVYHHQIESKINLNSNSNSNSSLRYGEEEVCGHDIWLPTSFIPILNSLLYLPKKNIIIRIEELLYWVYITQKYSLEITKSFKI